MLLSDDSIRNGYRQIDSFIITASSLEEVYMELDRILQSQPFQEDSNSYEIQQVFENQYAIIPKPETILMHLKSLIPQEIISVPPEFKICGKTILGGKIVVKEIYLRYSSSIPIARLLLILMHEISHKKRLFFANKNCWLPKTPEQFFNEAGLFIDTLIYGEHVKTALCNLSKIDEEIAEAILSKRPLNKIQAEAIFTDPLTKQATLTSTDESKQQLSDTDFDEDSHYVCDRGFYLHQIKRRNRLKNTIQNVTEQII